MKIALLVAYDRPSVPRFARQRAARTGQSALGEKLNLTAMRAAARDLIGEHDFSSFCRKGGGSLRRRLRAIRIERHDDDLVFKVEADSFCHQMVRSLVGLLLEVGIGKRPASDAA